MNIVQQRFAFAKAVGFTDIEILSTTAAVGTIDGELKKVPNYPEDIEATNAEIATLITRSLLPDYTNHLLRIVIACWRKNTNTSRVFSEEDERFMLSQATAEQKIEAALRVLERWDNQFDVVEQAAAPDGLSKNKLVATYLGWCAIDEIDGVLKGRSPFAGFWMDVPDYGTDIEAMREALSHLSDMQWGVFTSRLMARHADPDINIKLRLALEKTPAQLREAFIVTIAQTS